MDVQHHYIWPVSTIASLCRGRNDCNIVRKSERLVQIFSHVGPVETSERLERTHYIIQTAVALTVQYSEERGISGKTQPFGNTVIDPSDRQPVSGFCCRTTYEGNSGNRKRSSQ